MSRIGKQPINLPAGVRVTADEQAVTVSGPKGSLTQFAMPGIKVVQADEQVVVTRTNDEASTMAQHGLMRSLLTNMVEGVSRGFERKLELNGVGYRVNLAGSDLKFSLGFSHEVTYKLPEGVTAAIDQNIITIAGTDKQKVGQVAAEIRALKKTRTI